MLEITTEQNSVLLPVKVVPGASRTRYLGEWDGRARIAVAAPAERGKANKVLVAYLAETLGVRKGEITVVTGKTSPVKTIRIGRVAAGAVCAALQSDRS